MQSPTNDYVTGKPIRGDNPEESVRQEYERVLVHDYGYLVSEIDIEVPIPRGSSRRERADIVVFAPGSGRDPATDIVGIVETKKRGATDGLEQLKSYMTATSAIWGVWTDGDDIRYLAKPPGQNAVYDDQLNNIPARGQSLSDVGSLTKEDLKPYGRHELKAAFRRILHTLYANANISRREKLGNEMIKLLFAKIHDETTFPDRPPDFRAGFAEDPRTVKSRVDQLFARVADDLAQDGVFDSNDTITLDARGVAWVVGQLERGSLVLTDSDVVGDAFEVFAESKLVGEQGEFFTPRGVIEIAIKLAGPQPRQSICDPACGSGGFLISAMRHIWKQMDTDPEWRNLPSDRKHAAKQRMASQYIYGIDKEADLVRIAKAYMAISGDGRSNLIHENSLHEPSDFSESAQRMFSEDGAEFRTFDYVFTNPPYGTKTKVLTQDARSFDLGHRWSRPKGSTDWIRGDVQDSDPYLLFVERCVNMLDDGGTLAIVLPETAFHAPSRQHLRDWITERCAIRAVVSLPHNTFRPYCNAKTCLLVVQRRGTQGDVLMAHPEEMGHDHQGRPLFRPGTAEIWDDLAIVADDLDASSPRRSQLVFSVPWNEIVESGHWIPKYYRQRRSMATLPDGREWHRLGDIVNSEGIGAWDGHGSPTSTEKGSGDIPYIRVNDIVNWEMYRNPTSGVDASAYNRLAGRKAKPQAGDVIFVRRGSYRIGTVAMASPLDSDVLLTRELLTLRVAEDNALGITPFYLLALLSSDLVQSQIDGLVFIDTTLPNIGDRWKDILLPIHTDERDIQKISEQVESAVRRKWESQAMINDLSRDLGGVVT